MKVAVLGAGPAGLSCALTLEKLGISPDIYEQFDRCGGRVPFVVCLLQLMNRPVPDALANLKDRYGINITPKAVLNKIIRFSPYKMSTSSGNLGYIFEIGPGPGSINMELYKKLSSKIKFNTVADFKELAASYDRLVVAAGTSYIAKELGLWSDILRAWVRGALVEGDFDPNAWIIWLNKSYANNGYAYLGPFNKNKASIILIVTDIRENELEQKWQMFLDKEKITYNELQSFTLEHIIGTCRPKEVDNIVFAGNSGGLMESIFGFGIYNAVVSGVLAAQAIIEDTSYEKKVSFLENKLIESFYFRRKLNRCQNRDYDRLLGLIDFPPVNRLIYNTNLDVLGIHAKLTSLFNQ